MPAALMAAAASGEVRDLNNALVASGLRAVVTIPAQISFMACSAGRQWSEQLGDGRQVRQKLRLT
jgi:hypothetical protein